jgi:hypothetical protein
VYVHWAGLFVKIKERGKGVTLRSSPKFSENLNAEDLILN